MSDQTISLLPQPDQALVRQLLDLVHSIDKDNPSPDDIRALHAMLSDHPHLWRTFGDLARLSAQVIIKRLAPLPHISQSLTCAWQAMQIDLGYPQASPLERLVIEQVVLCWLHLYLIDCEYTAATSQPIPLDNADFWERRLSAAQRRYLRACDTLARIRKLARTTPALQVNIATHGGQQVNVLDAGPAEVSPGQT
ncbi:MAG: hypothetical protein Kow0063_41460 [Anaerolineae bacterium]